MWMVFITKGSYGCSVSIVLYLFFFSAECSPYVGIIFICANFNAIFYISTFFLQIFFLLYKKCWIQYVCFHESVGFCNFIDESVLISIGLHCEWLYHHFCFFKTKQKIFFQPNCILTSKTRYMKQINVLSTIFTSALLESYQYGLITNLEWSSLDIERRGCWFTGFGVVVGGKRNKFWKEKKHQLHWKIDNFHDGKLKIMK